MGVDSNMMRSAVGTVTVQNSQMKIAITHAKRSARHIGKRLGIIKCGYDMIDQCKQEGFVQKIKEEVGEGCNIHGSLEVNKVAGNFHFAAGKTFHQSNFNLVELLSLQRENYNISHKINRLAFGAHFPGIVNPLDGVHWTHDVHSGMHQYFLKVVPTIYTSIHGRTIYSNQYSVTEHYRPSEFGRA